MSVAEIKPRPDQYLSLESIRIDGGTQPRVSIDEEVVSEYAEALTADASFPPIIVFFDGTEHWLADGFHRYHAARKAGLANLLSEVRTGTRRDAVLYSVGANTAHGMRRTSADKQRAIEILLRDPEWVKWSDREIGRVCVVDHETVGRLRKRLYPPAAVTGENASERTYTSKHGTVAKMNTSNIGNGKPAKSEKREAILAILDADPMAPTPAIAEAVGCSDSFVSEVRNIVGKPSVRAIRAQGLEERRERFASSMVSLDGYVMGIEKLNVADFADDPRAEQWAGQLSKLIGSLRSVRQLLINGKETA